MRGTRGWKAQRRAGGRDKKRGRGVVERPHSMPHWVLIQNGRHLIKKRRRLLQIQKKKKKSNLFILHHNRTESLKGLFVLSQPQSTQAHLLRQAGLKFVIYDNCFLQKCKYLMTIISREAHTACCNVFIRWGQRNRWSTVLLILVKRAGRNAVSKQSYFHTWMHIGTHTGKLHWLQKNSQETCSLNVSDGVMVHTFYFFIFWIPWMFLSQN